LPADEEKEKEKNFLQIRENSVKEVQWNVFVMNNSCSLDSNLTMVSKDKNEKERE